MIWFRDVKLEPEDDKIGEINEGIEQTDQMTKSLIKFIIGDNEAQLKKLEEQAKKPKPISKKYQKVKK